MELENVTEKNTLPVFRINKAKLLQITTQPVLFQQTFTNRYELILASGRYSHKPGTLPKPYTNEIG